MKLKMNRSARAVANALACLATFGCGGVDDPDSIAASSQTEEAERRRSRSIDFISPTVSIQSAGTPSADGQIDLAGTAGDNFLQGLIERNFFRRTESREKENEKKDSSLHDSPPGLRTSEDNLTSACLRLSIHSK